jgi:hypothetical protein
LVGSAREEGTGLVGSVAGLVVFLAFVLFAVQLLVNLYATSAVTSATYDAARTVAASGDPSATAVQAAAEVRARDALGEYGQAISFSWAVDSTTVRLHVHATNPRFVLPVVGGAFPFATVDRTVVVRVEALR